VDFTIYERYHRCWLVFDKDIMGKLECIGYFNSDYAGDLNKCRSTTGYVYTLF